MNRSNIISSEKCGTQKSFSHQGKILSKKQTQSQLKQISPAKPFSILSSFHIPIHNNLSDDLHTSLFPLKDSSTQIQKKSQNNLLINQQKTGYKYGHQEKINRQEKNCQKNYFEKINQQTKNQNSQLFSMQTQSITDSQYKPAQQNDIMPQSNKLASIKSKNLQNQKQKINIQNQIQPKNSQKLKNKQNKKIQDSFSHFLPKNHQLRNVIGVVYAQFDIGKLEQQYKKKLDYEQFQQQLSFLIKRKIGMGCLIAPGIILTHSNVVMCLQTQTLANHVQFIINKPQDGERKVIYSRYHEYQIHIHPSYLNNQYENKLYGSQLAILQYDTFSNFHPQKHQQYLKIAWDYNFYTHQLKKLNYFNCFFSPSYNIVQLKYQLLRPRKEVEPILLFQNKYSTNLHKQYQKNYLGAPIIMTLVNGGIKKYYLVGIHQSTFPDYKFCTLLSSFSQDKHHFFIKFMKIQDMHQSIYNAHLDKQIPSIKDKNNYIKKLQKENSKLKNKVKEIQIKINHKKQQSLEKLQRNQTKHNNQQRNQIKDNNSQRNLCKDIVKFFKNCLPPH